MATHMVVHGNSRVLVWRIPQTENPQVAVHRVAKSQTRLKWLSTHTCIPFLMDLNSLHTGLSAPTLALSWPTRLSSRVISFLFLFFQAVSINIFKCRSHYEKTLPSLPQTHFVVVIVVQLLSHVWLFVTPWTAACQASLSSVLQSLLKFGHAI